MKKDVIYIDIEDEITSIISRLKDSKAKIIALVPPKRSTVLNSVVNLKLLKRAADDNKKRVVLITNERSLLALAGGLELHVAKNLHSKPEIPESEGAPEIDDSIIDGTQIADADSAEASNEKSSDPSQVDLRDVNGESAKQTKKKSPKIPAIKKTSGLKIPNFEAFRLRVFLALLGLVLLIGGWVWAFKIAPTASVTITAQTSRIDTEVPLSISSTAETDIEKGKLKAQLQQVRRTVTEQFQATGEKDVGEKASGEITIQNCRQSDPYEIVVGATFTSESGLVFETNETVEVPGGSFVLNECTAPGEATVGVTATKSGDNYNLAPQPYTNATAGIDGFGGQMSGGTSKKVKVVDQKDFDTAKKSLQERDFSDVKSELLELFDGEVVLIEESFETRTGKFTSDPKVGEVADKATMSVQITFEMMAVDRGELTQVIERDVNEKISTDQQSIYESGIDNVRFTLEKRATATRIEATLRAATHVGPEIDTGQLAEQIAGKPFSEARGMIESLPGVRSVVVDFDPFWISKAPSASKIDITVELAENTLQ